VSRRTAVRDGLADAAPMLIGIVPFGLVAGAAPIAAGLDVSHAIGLSVFLFAGASQLAVADVLGSGGGVAIAVLTAVTINLRLLLYSASLAPPLAAERLRSRLAAGYLLVDQAYALSIVRWDGTDDRRDRLPYYFAVAGLLWAVWQLTTVVGALAGASVPEEVPLDFAVPLVFLVLLVPVLDKRPSLVAAVVGGAAAVASAELGAARLSIMIGGLAGIAAGTVAEIRHERLGRVL
jgi:predicted branched-subunit amino acid permease